jgi:two-component system, LytTR family, response regulator
MRVVIVDDEPAARRTLREYCALEPDLEVIGEFGDGVTALEALRTDAPDLLFLDIQMGSLSGMELARALEPGATPLIVFVTAYDQYALEAFEVSATDYLLKPYDQERFRRTLVRVRQRRAVHDATERHSALAGLLTKLEQGRSASARILAESGNRMRLLDVAEVELVAADRNYVSLTLGREIYHARSTLQQAQRALQSQPMLRISRSCLVNVNHVREVSRTPRGDYIFVLAGGTTVTSSEGQREAVREYLSRFRVDMAQSG